MNAPKPPKKQEPPRGEEGIPPWMATFADMVTLLLCFFVLLLSFTTQDINNFKMLMGSVQEALGVQYEDRASRSIPYAETSFREHKLVRENREIVEMGARLKQFIRAQDLTSIARVSREKSGVMLRVGNSALFAQGSARLTPGARRVLAGVVDALKNSDFNMVIRGHTDGERPEPGMYHSNWELSAARAAACLRYVLEHSDISARRMKAVGYASAKPFLPSTTAANKAANRRVEFFFLPNGDSKW
ncbi:flagellar motor protein MotB [Pseudodesulfovibrio tunisiensis]|uniref:flagellar motor protein MotB n=1 Tax=Pseudodesulfovibrio tunisiensis TaxID=463192 RepID=UPI001FB36C0D|nr:flagellar motor protein MotB [Pseudodesulfovibrio tunisiensis]